MALIVFILSSIDRTGFLDGFDPNSNFFRKEFIEGVDFGEITQS